MSNAIWVLIGIVLGALLNHFSIYVQKKRDQRIELFKIRKNKIEEVALCLNKIDLTIKKVISGSIETSDLIKSWKNNNLFEELNFFALKTIILLYFPKLNDDLFLINKKLIELSEIIQNSIAGKSDITLINFPKYYYDLFELLNNLLDKCIESSK